MHTVPAYSPYATTTALTQQHDAGNADNDGEASSQRVGRAANLQGDAQHGQRRRCRRFHRHITRITPLEISMLATEAA